MIQTVFTGMALLTLAHTRTIQRCLRDWIDISAWNDPHAVTLTMKQVRFEGSGPFRTMVRLDAEKASRNLRHFLNALNRKFLGNLGRRQGQRISVIPILEGTKTKHLHYHLVMDSPLRSDPEGIFETTIRNLWSSTHWGDRQVHITSADSGWIDYITKTADKVNFADAIDWTNAHLPGKSPPVVDHRWV